MNVLFKSENRVAQYAISVNRLPHLIYLIEPSEEYQRCHLGKTKPVKLQISLMRWSSIITLKAYNRQEYRRKSKVAYANPLFNDKKIY